MSGVTAPGIPTGDGDVYLDARPAGVVGERLYRRHVSNGDRAVKIHCTNVSSDTDFLGDRHARDRGEFVHEADDGPAVGVPVVVRLVRLDSVSRGYIGVNDALCHGRCREPTCQTSSVT